MELTTQQINDLKQKELQLFSAFIQICDKLNLKYYILGGTLLGAVRHHGFIPWDDDIDVGMLRADYDLFLNAAPQYLPKDYFLQTYITDPEFPHNFAKLRDSNTTFVENSSRNLNINHGVFIDIFPLDYHPDTGAQLLNFRHLLQKIRITDAFTDQKLKLRTKFVRLFTRILYPSIPAVVNARETLMKSTPSGKKIANYCGAWGVKEIVPCEWYGDGTTLLFEGLEVTAPTCYHEWLTQVYGDYMQLPPVDKRTPHHYVAAFDLHTPYSISLKKR